MITSPILQPEKKKHILSCFKFFLLIICLAFFFSSSISGKVRNSTYKITLLFHLYWPFNSQDLIVNFPL